MKKFKFCTTVMVVVAISLFIPLAQAGISANVGVEDLGAEVYKYTIDLTWDLSHGLSHWDLLLKPGCAEDDHLIWFDGEGLDGLSDGVNADDNPITNLGWTGYFSRDEDDGSTGAEAPLIKYESPHSPVGAEAAATGSGQFWFYSNIIPEDGGGVVVAKWDSQDGTGVFTGVRPSCNVPEPATLALLSLGGLLLRRKK